MIISLYAGGMTLRDIGHHLASTIGTELSHETISKIVDKIGEEVLAWQRRPLEALDPVTYLDAIVVKVRDGAHVGNKSAHIAVGVDIEGIKHVLGIWVQATECAKFGGMNRPGMSGNCLKRSAPRVVGLSCKRSRSPRVRRVGCRRSTRRACGD